MTGASRGIALALALSLLASGCGGGGGHSTASTARSTTTSRHTGPSGASQEGPKGRAGRGKPLSRGFHVRLSAARSGSGGPGVVAHVVLNGAKHRACWSFGRLPVTGQHSSAFGQVHSRVVPDRATINAGTSRRNRGPVLVPLGVHYTARGCTPVGSSIINAILSAPADYYLEVESARYPNGRLRGQL